MLGLARKPDNAAAPRVMVVEDETIIGMDIRHRLDRLGYDVAALVCSGEDAIAKAKETTPDLVLMDITLSGEIDGIEAARQIRSSLDIPVIYLTAHSDNNTLGRARVTEPHGYLLKPFKERDLHVAIDMALYKHRMDRKLKESEQRFFTTLKSIGDAVIATDEKGLVTFMNPAAEKLTGWTHQEAAAQELTKVFNLIDEETCEAIEFPAMKQIEEGLVISLPDRVGLVAKDRSEVPIGDSIAPIRNERGNIAGAVLVFRDLSRERQLQRQLLQSEKLNALGQLASGMAHEINNPLTSVVGFASILLARFNLDEPVREHIQLIRDEGERAGRIVRNLLTFSRQKEAGRVEVDLNELLAHMLEIREHAITVRNTLLLREFGNIPRVFADPDAIQQVFLNLIINADQAMLSTKRGGTLKVSTTLTEQGDLVIVAIADDGPGIPREQLERIFDPFFTTKGVGEGTGLGLSICYGIVREHGGKIRVESESGKGATFFVELPVTRRKTSSDEA